MTALTTFTVPQPALELPRVVEHVAILRRRALCRLQLHHHRALALQLRGIPRPHAVPPHEATSRNVAPCALHRALTPLALVPVTVGPCAPPRAVPLSGHPLPVVPAAVLLDQLASAMRPSALIERAVVARPILYRLHDRLHALLHDSRLRLRLHLCVPPRAGTPVGQALPGPSRDRHGSHHSSLPLLGSLSHSLPLADEALESHGRCELDKLRRPKGHQLLVLLT